MRIPQRGKLRHNSSISTNDDEIHNSSHPVAAVTVEAAVKYSFVV